MSSQRIIIWKPPPGRVGRDEQGEARRAKTKPNSGPPLELERVRLKTWSISDFSIAETTWSTYLYIYSINILQSDPGYYFGKLLAAGRQLVVFRIFSAGEPQKNFKLHTSNRSRSTRSNRSSGP